MLKFSYELRYIALILLRRFIIIITSIIIV